ncbi:Os06g0102750 [Oryza sativa Japonica Group]|uniref:Os06g0102750 protein n=1 Tax=Oryza sativa subsp. japonica TaxID=39947 RepID=A0A0P0WRW5_ORYSJ|nr:Os06g0102750 [Oryza sativa Japonica Group]
MGHIGEAGGGAVVMGCKVLPMWRESGGMVDGARKTMVHGKKAVARVKELLRRAAQPRSPHPHPQATGASRWKKKKEDDKYVLHGWQKVMSFQARDSSNSKAGNDSTSKLSFKWDAGSCSSASSSAMYSPLSAVSAPAKAPSSQQQLRPWSTVPDDGEQRMAQWITTDSDCICGAGAVTSTNPVPWDDGVEARQAIKLQILMDGSH